VKKKTTSDASEIMDRLFFNAPERRADLEQTRREMALGMKIRRIREEAGLTQQQLADRIDTHGSAISRIEDADYDKHSMDTLQKVATAFGMLLVVDFVKPPKRKKRA
jgi:ribosome-binding protein aMBF1 (putative translation factor)